MGTPQLHWRLNLERVTNQLRSRERNESSGKAAPEVAEAHHGSSKFCAVFALQAVYTRVLSAQFQLSETFEMSDINHATRLP